jgi:hypothetical protein
MKKLLLFLLLASGSVYGLQQQDQNPTRYFFDVVPVKVHLTLNQDGYLAGDTIFFKAFVQPVGHLAPAKIRTILNIVLENPDGTNAQYQTIRVENGEAANQVILNPSLPSGKYRLIAYNDWMEKFDPSLFFQKIIWIGDPSTKKESEKIEYGVYPEGGNFVANVNQRLVVRGRAGGTGVIKNSSSETIAEFSLDQFGLASVHLMPSAGEQYRAEFSDNKSVSLPEIKGDGFAVALTDVGSNTVRVNVQVPEKSAWRNKQMLYTVSSDGQSFQSGFFQLNDQSSFAVDVPLANISPGVAAFSLFANKELVAERLFFIAEGTTVTPTITLPAENPGTREKVEAVIQLPQGSSGSANSKLAVTVFNKNNIISDVNDKSIDNSFSFYYGVSSTSANSANFFLNSSPDAAAVDKFLITQRWKASLRPAPDNKQLFSSRLHIKGRVVSLSGQPVPDSAKINLLLERSVSNFYAYVKDSRFDASIWMDFFGEETVFYRVVYKDKILEDVRLIPDQYPIEIGKITESGEEVNTFVGKRRSINKSFQYYKTGSGNVTVAALNKQFEEEIFAPDVQVNLTDYILFPTMEETLREVVPYIQHRKEKGKHVVRVIKRVGEFKRVAEMKPLFVIDGVITDDTDIFLRMKPSDISTIKLIHRQEKLDMFGDLGRGGIVLVETKIPDFAETMPKPETVIKATGNSEPLQFRPSRYNDSNARIPDLRTSLFWSPNIMTNENGSATVSFFTNDIAGDFVMKVEGMTSDGKPFSAVKEFRVTFKP